MKAGGKPNSQVSRTPGLWWETDRQDSGIVRRETKGAGALPTRLLAALLLPWYDDKNKDRHHGSTF